MILPTFVCCICILLTLFAILRQLIDIEKAILAFHLAYIELKAGMTLEEWKEKQKEK